MPPSARRGRAAEGAGRWAAGGQRGGAPRARRRRSWRGARPRRRPSAAPWGAAAPLRPPCRRRGSTPRRRPSPCRPRPWRRPSPSVGRPAAGAVRGAAWPTTRAGRREEGAALRARRRWAQEGRGAQAGAVHPRRARRPGPRRHRRPAGRWSAPAEGAAQAGEGAAMGRPTAAQEAAGGRRRGRGGCPISPGEAGGEPGEPLRPRKPGREGRRGQPGCPTWGEHQAGAARAAPSRARWAAEGSAPAAGDGGRRAGRAGGRERTDASHQRWLAHLARGGRRQARDRGARGFLREPFEHIENRCRPCYRPCLRAPHGMRLPPPRLRGTDFAHIAQREQGPRARPRRALAGRDRHESGLR